MQSLGPGYCTYALDQRGRGLSDWASADTYHTQSYVEDLEDWLAHSMKESGGGVTWRHNQQGIAKARLNIEPTDLWPAVRVLDCPSLFIRGGRSDFLPAQTLQAMSACNPNIRTVEVADASHYVHDDQSEVFNALVSGFLRELKSEGLE